MKRSFGLYVLIVITIMGVGCSTIDGGYDDLIYIETVNTTTHGEDAAFEKYFSHYINRVADDYLIATPSYGRAARYLMKITIVESSQDNAGHRIHRNTEQGYDKSRPVTYYNYKIKIDLIDNKDQKRVWTWEPDRWKTFSTPEKSIKWLAKYSAKRMVKAGLFRSKYIGY